MRCPKCGARIGIFRQQLTLTFGSDTGTSCYICGYWVLNFPVTARRTRDGS